MLALKRFQTFDQNSTIETLNSFKEQIRNNELLNLKYKTISVLWVSNKSVLIPNEFYSEQFAFESFQLCHELSEEEVLEQNNISALESYCVFSIPNNFKEVLIQQFSTVKFYHHTYPFYSCAIKEEPHDNNPNIFVNIQKSFFHIIIPDRNNKHFINSFSYTEDSDLAYYILNVYKQQKLNNERSKLIVDGLIQEESKSIQLLKKYLAHVEVKLLPTELRIKNAIPHKEYNQYINLINLSRCE